MEGSRRSPRAVEKRRLRLRRASFLFHALLRASREVMLSIIA